jgi:hypothetical protein
MFEIITCFASNIIKIYPQYFKFPAVFCKKERLIFLLKNVKILTVYKKIYSVVMDLKAAGPINFGIEFICAE